MYLFIYKYIHIYISSMYTCPQYLNHVRCSHGKPVASLWFPVASGSGIICTFYHVPLAYQHTSQCTFYFPLSIFGVCCGRKTVAFPVLLETHICCWLWHPLSVCVILPLSWMLIFMFVLCFLKQGVNFPLCER